MQARTEIKNPSPQSSEENLKTEKGKKIKETRKVSTIAQQTIFKGEINAYGFIHLSKPLAEGFGAKKGEKQPITIELQGDALKIRKA